MKLVPSTVLVACLATTAARADLVRTVALTGDAAPGTSVGVNYSGFFGPVLNDSGQTAFYGALTGTGVTGGNDSGIWSEGGGSGLQKVAREGEQAPGTAVGVNFSAFSITPVLNDSGQTAFTAVVTGTGVTSANDLGIWSGGGGSGLQKVAREGEHAPGTAAGVNYSRFDSLVLNDSGQTAFTGLLTGAGVTSANDRGIWSEGGGSGLQKIAREGDQAPGTAAGVNFSNVTPPVLNDSGQTAFVGDLTGTGVTGANDRGIWSEGGGSGLQIVAREGDQAPGTAAGVQFSTSFSAPALNDSGQTAFVGRLTGTGVTGANDIGIWSEGGGSGLQIVARGGDQAPGTAAGVNFSTSLSAPALNDSGQTAFVGGLTGTGVTGANDRGIWAEDLVGNLTLVAREGEQAPGTAAGVNFGGLVYLPALNDNGQTAFFGILTGTGVTGANDRGIWAEDLVGNLRLVVREGDQLDVDEGPLVDHRTISSITPFSGTGSSGGRPSLFNNLGEIAFRASFTDGSSGVFVSSLVAVPEPSAALVWSVLTSGVFLRPRRRKPLG